MVTGRMARKVMKVVVKEQSKKLLSEIEDDIKVAAASGKSYIMFPNCSDEVYKVTKRFLKKAGYSIKRKKSDMSGVRFSIYEYIIKW